MGNNCQPLIFEPRCFQLRSAFARAKREVLRAIEATIDRPIIDASVGNVFLLPNGYPDPRFRKLGEEIEKEDPHHGLIEFSRMVMTRFMEFRDYNVGVALAELNICFDGIGVWRA